MSVCGIADRCDPQRRRTRHRERKRKQREVAPLKAYREQGLPLFEPERDVPARVARSLQDDRLRLSHSKLLPVAELDADPRDAPRVAGGADHDGVEFFNQSGVAPDVVSVVVRVQDEVQPAIKPLLDEVRHGPCLSGVDHRDGAGGLVEQDPGVVVREARDAEDGEAAQWRRGEGAPGRGRGLWERGEGGEGGSC